MTVIDYIRLIGTEFSEVTDEQLNSQIEFWKPWVSKTVFGEMYERALALMICHKMKMAGYGQSPLGEIASVSNGFGVASISDGGSSISFASNGLNNLTTDAEYALTIYGTQFLQLRKAIVIPIRMSGEQYV